MRNMILAACLGFVACAPTAEQITARNTRIANQVADRAETACSAVGFRSGTQEHWNCAWTVAKPEYDRRVAEAEAAEAAEADQWRYALAGGLAVMGAGLSGYAAAYGNAAAYRPPVNLYQPPVTTQCRTNYVGGFNCTSY